MATNNAINANSSNPFGVTDGGTGASSQTAYAVLCGGTSSTGAYQSVAALGSAGDILTSNGAGNLPTFQAPAAAGVSSATGTANQIDVSAATGAVTWSIPSTFTSPGSVTATTTFNLPTTSSTDGQLIINSVPIVHTYGTANTFLGGAGNFTLTTGSAQNETALGLNALSSLTTGTDNTALGSYSQNLCTTGAENTAIGYQSLQRVTTGGRNIAIGNAAGFAWTSTESDNIIIGTNIQGTAADANTIRIGATGAGNYQQNKCFIAAIRGITTVNNDAIAVLVDSAGQLGTVSSSIRYKENVMDMNDYSSALLALRPVVFNLKARPDGSLHTGLIAEEVMEAMPELVALNNDGAPESVKYHDLPALLLNELQKAIKRIEALENK